MAPALPLAADRPWKVDRYLQSTNQKDSTNTQAAHAVTLSEKETQQHLLEGKITQ